MRIANDKDDAIQIIKQIKSEMRTAQNSLARLEFLLYELDDRAEIKFFERGKYDTGTGKERVKSSKGYGEGYQGGRAGDRTPNDISYENDTEL